MSRPLCFVLMPFGQKKDAEGKVVDFDAVYAGVIKPAIEEAEMVAIRADEELTGGVIHKPMYERLILCEYAVADLTLANANVFYELGLRHAVRRHSTVSVFAAGGAMPFDVAPLRALPYRLENGKPVDAAEAKAQLAERLREAYRSATGNPEGATDSPLFQLVEDYPNVAPEKTDAFRRQAADADEAKRRLAAAREAGAEAVRAVEAELGNLRNREAGVVVDLMRSYRAVKAWPEMIALVGKMSRPLAETALVQEQLAFALNRAGRGEEAERVLKELIDERRGGSETFGLLGRVYKDRWQAAVGEGKTILARGLLDKAIEAYLGGFEADWRDFYPGVNAVTLMTLRDPPDARRAALIPVVAYAVERRIAAGKPDYWDYATRLELAVLAGDQEKAAGALGDALAAVGEAWEPETTLRNLRLIREAREKRGTAEPWMKEIEDALAA
jgi:tetratricopeptide (TPR) repeat protein